MNAPFADAAKACLFSTVAGLALFNGSVAFAETGGGARREESIEDSANEPKKLIDAEPSAAPAARARMSLVGKPKSKAKPAVKQAATDQGAANKANDVEQTAGFQGQTAPSATGMYPVAPVRTSPANGSSSPVQQKLEELYRKNGRPMPDMSMDEYQMLPTPTAPQYAPPQRPGAAGMAMGGAQRTMPRASKPNFFERIFRVGRGRQKLQPAAQQSAPQQSTLPQPDSNGPVRTWPAPTREPAQPPSGMPYGPYRTGPAVAPAPASAPANRSLPLPRTQTQATRPGMREPTPLAPLDDDDDDLETERESAAARANRNRDSQPLLDESDDAEGESLDLSQDDAAPSSPAPQVAANPTNQRVESSPYTGLTIRPNETEQSIASQSGASSQLTAEAPATLPAPVAQKPVAPNEAATAAVPAARAPAGDELLMTLDDDKDDDDDEESLTIPGEDVGAKSTHKPAPAPAAENHERKVEAGEEGPKLLKGFRRYCPVLLKDERKLVEAKPQFASNHRGMTYMFSSAAAKATFEENPRKYVPASGGSDVVRLASGDTGVEGSLEYAAWYRGRLYLFSSAESRKAFVETPSRYIVTE
ncbi:MAG: hypothetical protein ACT4QC_10630 [Planctomycetaceae bacterium]